MKGMVIFMKYYIITDENASYFYKPNIGICKKSGYTGAETEVIASGIIDEFGIFRNNFTHMVYANENNEIIYMKQGKNPVPIIAGKNGIRPYDFILTGDGESPALFYKAEHNGEILIFYCVLSGNSRPVSVGNVSREHTEYSVGNGRVCFTSKDNSLVYKEFRDNTFSNSVFIAKNGYMPHYASIGEKDYIVYCDGENIVVNGIGVVPDPYALKPVLFPAENKLCLQWQSGAFVKYVTSDDGIKWSKPVKYIGNGYQSVIITYVTKNCSHSCYGYAGNPFTPIK